MQDFKNKVAVITGAAEGIGKALATVAAARRMKLVLADLNAATLEKTAAEFAAEGAEVVTHQLDVSKADQVEALAEKAYRAFGAVHVLANNAGIGVGNTSWETSLSEWEWVLGVNLYGVIHGLRSFVPRMLAGGEEGHIVNTASAAGLLTAPSMASYNVSKFAVVTLTEGLHHDLTLRRTKLHAHVLCPAWVQTRIHDSTRYLPDDLQRAAAEQCDPVVAQIRGAIVKAVETGISPAEVARQVFEAFEQNQFYIVTHDMTKAGVKVRMDDILTPRPPTLLSFQ
ncbi:MAG: SDR family NAD(P)-dependent oxidoreductase [Verrucomicrobia bacterium]|nr:SDR family NAD(P)-dependent oxidoreductase [Verrucomicrobiota bacterium]